MANKNILVNVDYHGNQILNVLAQVLASDPGSPAAGQFWYRSDLKQISFYDGTTVQRSARVADSLSVFAAPTADVPWGSHKITGLLDPTLAQDAATKNYVDSAVQGLDTKAPVKYATTAALPSNTYANGASGVGATLTAVGNVALPTIDGQTPAANDRILVKNEATQANNGIYVVTQVGVGGTSPYILTRSTDFNTATPNVPGTIQSGAYTFVELGTAQAGNGWEMIQSAAITVGTTALPWVQFTAAASYSAGDGIEIVGAVVKALFPFKRNAQSIAVANVLVSNPGTAVFDGVTLTAGQRLLLTAQTTASQNGLWVFNGSAAALTRPTDYAAGETAQAFFDATVFIDSGGTTYPGTEWRITTTGAITIDTTSTTWAQVPTNVGAGGVTGVLAVANGGTGSTTAASARSALGAIGRFAQTIGDNATTTFTITHSLGSNDVIVQVYQVATPFDQVEPEIQYTSTTVVTLVFAVAPTTNQYRVVVMG